MVVSGKIMNNTKLHNFNVKSLFFIILTILFLNLEVVYSHALEDKDKIESPTNGPLVKKGDIPKINEEAKDEVAKDVEQVDDAQEKLKKQEEFLEE